VKKLPNKQLTAKVKLNITDAEKKLERLNRLFRNLDKATTQVGANNKVEKQLTRSQNKAQSVVNKIKEWARTQNLVTATTRSTNNALGGVWHKLKGIASTYLGIMGGRALVKTSDIITSAQNRLNNLNGGDKQLTQEHMDKMYVSANNARMAYTDMLSNASKSMTLAGGAFQDNMDNAIRFQEIMAKTYALGGASAEEMSSSMYQMIQALGSGTLAGDELRSVREGAPLAYKDIEKYVQGIMAQSEATKDFATKSLKDIASEGLVTSEMVVAAVMDAGDKIDKQFEETAMTFGQAWDRIKSSAVKAFEPVSNRLNEMLNRAAENGMFEKIEIAFVNISKVLQIVFEVIYRSISWIADNWNWLQHVIIGGLILYVSYLIMTTAVAIAQAVARIAMWVMEYGWILLIIAGILALVYVFYLWKTGAIDTCQAIVSALLIIGVVVALIGLLMGGWIVAIIGLVIAAIGLIIQYLDYFLAVVYSVGAGIYNIVIGILDGIIQAFWSIFVDPIKGVIEWFVNAWNGAFTSVGGAFANFCGQLLSGLVGLIKPFAKLLDKIFGWDTNGAIESAQAAMKSWGKKENAITYSVEAPTAASLLNKTGLNLPERIAYTDAWNKGLEHGAAGKEWLSGLGSKYQTGFGDFSLDSIGKTLGLDFGGVAGTNGVGGLGGGTPSTGVGGSYKKPNAEDLLSGIADDTGKISDAMDLTEEDLSYLREVANMEWKKEFTTATIVVDMKNNNTINGDGDLDGIVTRLADRLYEEMDYLANGVYA
jgi:tape measure domain-containing protein